MNTVLISTYELGRQPFGLASPAAWLGQAGARVTCLDLAVEPVDEAAIRGADLVAFYLPMHTATRIATRLVNPVRELNPHAHLCFYGLYAPVNEAFLRKLGAGTVLGGEYESGLLSLVGRLRNSNGDESRDRGSGSQTEPRVSLGRQSFRVPDRSGLPELVNYARLVTGEGGSRDMRVVGYTEASRGCKHLCRHCPVVPVYDGAFRVVQREVVLQDIRQQVEAGAEHITFGDPDFFNGPGHALAVVHALHQQHPSLTYDVTIKIEHLLRHGEHLAALQETGCVLVTSAVESVDDSVLQLLEKGHTRRDFYQALDLCRQAGLALNPTFVPFTPWTTLEAYQELLAALVELDLVGQVAPIQLAMRLLIPNGSRLLQLAETRKWIGPFDEASLIHPWRHPDPRMDELQGRIETWVQEATSGETPRRAVVARIWELTEATAGSQRPFPVEVDALPRATIPYLNEPWYC